MKSPSAPPAPDYTGAAQATAAGNLDAAKYATEANRVNQYTPWGSLTWTQGAGTPTTQAGTAYNGGAFNAQKYMDANPDVARSGLGAQEHYSQYGRGEGRQAFYDDVTVPGSTQWTQSMNLTPQAQAALDAQMQVQQNQSQLGLQMQGQVKDVMSKPFQAPDYASYMAGVPGVNTSFDRFNPSSAGKTNTNAAGATAGAGGVALGNQYWMQGVNPVNQSSGSYLGNVPGISAFNTSGLQQAGSASGGNVATDASQWLGDVPGVNYDSRSLTGGAQPVNYDAPTLDQNAYKQYTDAAYGASTRLLQDGWNQQNGNMDVQLRLQGLTPGTEAYNNAMGNALKSQDFTKAQIADTSILTGTSVANQNYQAALAGYKARNEAQNQDFGQRLQNYNANLAAQQQGFGQGMSKANFAQTGMDMNSKNGIAAAAVNVSAAQANNQAALAAYNANLNAQGQAFNQGMTRFGADQGAQQQAYNQGRSNFADYNASQNQAFSQGLAGFESGNAAQQQAYNQELAGFGANQASTQASNAAQQQAFTQSQQNYGTAYQSALSNYTMPLNMMNSVLNGNQVSQPTFGGYYTQGQTAGPDYSGATNALGSWNQGLYNAQSATANGINNGLFSLGSAWLMSDKRLKKNVRFIGKTGSGLNWYAWDWWNDSGSATGVIAQEVPHAAALHPSGYLMVDYARIH